jgi:pyrroline-5-carboxylate reductase
MGRVTEATALPTIAILGIGSMGRAILEGLLDPQVVVDGAIRVTSRSSERIAEFAGSSAVHAVATSEHPKANRDAVTGAKIVLVAVKPAMIAGLLAEIAADLSPDAVIVSVAAGVTIQSISSKLPDSISVLRAMPNTPSRIGRGVTGLSAGNGVTPADLAAVTALFETVGAVIPVPESQIDALSAISGSGPAYVFYFIEALESAARAKGFSAEQAAVLVGETFAGSVQLLAASGQTAAELRRQVTSPNGTTERAIAAFEAGHIPQSILRGVDQAIERAGEIAASM